MYSTFLFLSCERLAHMIVNSEISVKFSRMSESAFIVNGGKFYYNHNTKVRETGTMYLVSKENEMRKKYVHLYLVFLLTASFIISGCAAQAKGPGIQFKSEQYDFGTVAAGKIVNHDFEFTNNGTDTLLIPEALSTCECTKIIDFDKEIKPGKSGKVSVEFNTKDIDGKATRTILVSTNIPDKAEIPLTIEATVVARPAAGKD
jgi:hypothetical protein